MINNTLTIHVNTITLHNRSIQDEDIIIVNIYAPNRKAKQYIRQKWTVKEKLTVTQS